jgi:hypothetical protein
MASYGLITGFTPPAAVADQADSFGRLLSGNATGREGSAVPIRRREQRTVDGSLASTSIERLLSGFRHSERTTAYVCSTS